MNLVRTAYQSGPSGSSQPVRACVVGWLRMVLTQLDVRVSSGIGFGRLGSSVGCGNIEWSVELVGEVVESAVMPYSQQ